MEVRTPYYPYYLRLGYQTFKTAKIARVFHSQLPSRLSTIKHAVNWIKVIRKPDLSSVQVNWNEEFIEYVKQRYIP